MLQWHILSESGTELERLNGHGWGVPLERGVPAEWETSPYFMAGHGIFNRPLRLSDLGASLLRSLSCSGCPHLVFYTSCINSFQLGVGVVQAGDQERLNPTASAPAGCRPQRFSIVDWKSEWVGTVLLDGRVPDSIDWRNHEFILLSEAQYFDLDDEERLDVGEFPNYLVMLVQRDDQTGVSSRLGLGRVRRTAWLVANPVPKLVALG